MTETTRCEHCGVLDALGRHDGACSYALDVGLPRLAEGEPPIDPSDEGELGPEDPNLESGYDGPIAAEGEVSPNHPAHPQWHDKVAHQRPDGLYEVVDRPGAIERAPAEIPELWMAYKEDITDAEEFDAVIFPTELDALRHAVKEGYKVHPLELGRSLRDQVHAS